MKLFPGELNSFPVSVQSETDDAEIFAGRVYDIYAPAIYAFLIRHAETEIANKLLVETFCIVVRDIITQRQPPSEIRLIKILHISRKLIQDHNPDIKFKI